VPEMNSGRRFAPPTAIPLGTTRWCCPRCGKHGTAMGVTAAIATLERHQRTDHPRPQEDPCRTRP